MHAFQTHSTPRKLVLTVLFTFIPLFALAFLGLKIAVATWLFFELILVITLAFCMIIVSRNRWELSFTDSILILRNIGNGQSYRFTDLDPTDFVITQNSRQKAKNCCDLRIGDTPFRLYDVQNHSALMDYIQVHCN